jgi:DNA-binding IclR family transcriptional regulator
MRLEPMGAPDASAIGRRQRQFRFTPAALRIRLEQVRTAGYALDDEEHAVGRRCIAAPIFDETGETIAAISASGPMARGAQ